MASIKIIPATFFGVHYVADNLREADKVEVKAFTGQDAGQRVRSRAFDREGMYEARIGETPVVLFGVRPYSILSRTASVWMLGTDRIKEIPRTVVRKSKEYISEFLEMYDRLENWVDARNKISLNWVKWCGFDVGEPVPLGQNGELFHPIWIERNV